MKIVIDIDEELYNRIRADSGVYVMDDILVENAIYEGTPLPKGHGRLIDADALFNDSELDYTIDGLGCVKWSDIRKAPTVVEADKEGKE